MKKLSILLLLLASVPCFAQQKEKDPFIGMDKNAIIEKYGEPTSIERDGKKGKVLVYKKDVQTGPAATGSTVYLSNQTYTFSIDGKGKVYAWKFTPASQPATPIIAN